LATSGLPPDAGLYIEFSKLSCEPRRRAIAGTRQLSGKNVRHLESFNSRIRGDPAAEAHNIDLVGIEQSAIEKVTHHFFFYFPLFGKLPGRPALCQQHARVRIGALKIFPQFASLEDPATHSMQ